MGEGVLGAGEAFEKVEGVEVVAELGEGGGEVGGGGDLRGSRFEGGAVGGEVFEGLLGGVSKGGGGRGGGGSIGEAGVEVGGEFEVGFDGGECRWAFGRGAGEGDDGGEGGALVGGEVHTRDAGKQAGVGLDGAQARLSRRPEPGVGGEGNG